MSIPFLQIKTFILVVVIFTYFLAISGRYRINKVILHYVYSIEFYYYLRYKREHHIVFLIYLSDHTIRPCFISR